jgi:tetratricopeptide (TPR) repeat protein
MTCHACGAQLSSSAKFCHKCGAAIGGMKSTGWRGGLPWTLAGVALGALLTVVALRATGAGSREQGAVPPAASARPPDISQMSPEDAANRLFNRVMMAAEAGKTDSVQFFLPMALMAYGRLTSLDADARYHIGLLHLAGGDIAAALAQADTIQRTVPTHLFIYVLRAHAHQQQGNTQQQRRAYADFIKNERGELARNLPEYAEHQSALTAFKAEASRVTARPGS